MGCVAGGCQCQIQETWRSCPHRRGRFEQNGLAERVGRAEGDNGFQWLRSGGDETWDCGGGGSLEVV